MDFMNLCIIWHAQPTHNRNQLFPLEAVFPSRPSWVDFQEWHSIQLILSTWIYSHSSALPTGRHCNPPQSPYIHSSDLHPIPFTIPLVPSDEIFLGLILTRTSQCCVHASSSLCCEPIKWNKVLGRSPASKTTDISTSHRVLLTQSSSLANSPSRYLCLKTYLK